MLMGNHANQMMTFCILQKHFMRTFINATWCHLVTLKLIFNHFHQKNILDDINSAKCEGLVSYNKCEKSLNKMKKNKSPGLDGVTTEFYQTFWQVIGNLLIDVCNESHENGNLPDTQKESSHVFNLLKKMMMKTLRTIDLLV